MPEGSSSREFAWGKRGGNVRDVDASSKLSDRCLSHLSTKRVGGVAEGFWREAAKCAHGPRTASPLTLREGKCNIERAAEHNSEKGRTTVPRDIYRPGAKVQKYRCEATSVGGFVQQLAVSYVQHGYRFWTSGTIPEGKDPRRTDLKLVEKYECYWSSAERVRRKKRGQANAQYIRHENFWVLIVTPGEHLFFEPIDNGGESRLVDHVQTGFRDVQRQPICYRGYSISFRQPRPQMGEDGVEHRGKPRLHVGIQKQEYLRLRSWLEDIATRRSVAELTDILQNLPFEPYRSVFAQARALRKRVNEARRAAGCKELLPFDALRATRRPFRPFENIKEIERVSADREAA